MKRQHNKKYKKGAHGMVILLMLMALNKNTHMMLLSMIYARETNYILTTDGTLRFAHFASTLLQQVTLKNVNNE